MADPRNYMTYKCSLTAATRSSNVRAFGNAIGKIGDLQVLNSIGAGKIGQGLRTLASISNTIRSGCGSLPTSIGSTLESGANWVLNQTGIGPSVIDAVKGFNPAIANQAWGQAQSVYNQVKQGKFTMTSVPGVLQDLQNLERLGRNIFTGDGSNAMQSVQCLNSPYALDLIARAPKHKFLFVVSFTFNPAYASMQHIANEMAFVVKRSTRPGIKFQMDDVNYYNFRSKVVTKTEFEEMSMTFHDDMTNNAMDFYNAYRNALSPITNLGNDQPLLDPESSGMGFSELFTSNNQDQLFVPTSGYAASFGPLVNNTITPLQSIQVFHVFDGGRLMNVFKFNNPRISDMTLDDVDMAESGGSEVGIKFAYDSVHIETGIDANISKYTNGSSFLPNSSTGSLYPLRYNSSPGAMSAALQSVQPYGAQGATNSCDPLNTMSNGTGGNLFTDAKNAISGAASSVADALGNFGSSFTSGLSNFGGNAAQQANDLADTTFI